MPPLLESLYQIWGRISYLIGLPEQAFGQWAWQHSAYYLLSPEAFLLIGVVVICVVEIFSRRDNFLLAAWIAIIALLGNFMMTVHMMFYTSQYFGYGLGTWWGGLETVDPYAIFFKQLMDWGDILIVLALICYPKLKKYRVEFIILLLSGTVAFDLMVGSSDLLMVYVMTEFGGICGYIMAAFYKRSLLSLESGLKYFITGAASSTALLFAMSVLYGAVNTTNFYTLKQLFASGAASTPPVVFSIVLILVALGYKVGLAPFHLWVADVYEGAPTPVTAFISVFPKVAGYAVLLRLLLIPFLPATSIWVPIVIIMVILSLAFGNAMAMRQTSFKRMMAFSGVSHMGYIMMGVIAAAYADSDPTRSIGFMAAMYYMLVYTFMNLGIFITAMVVESYGGTDHLDSYNGLIRRNAFMTVLITILLMALIGLPPTTGFWAKFLVFYSVAFRLSMAQSMLHIGSVVIPLNLVMLLFAVVTTVLGAYYYMRLGYRMWALPPLIDRTGKFEPKLFARLAILVPVLLIFLLGMYQVSVPFDYAKNAWFLTSYDSKVGY